MSDNSLVHAPLTRERVELCASTLRCGQHLWEFDARTGLGINPRSCSLRRYPVQVVDGGVYVQIEART
jgi:toluene monooxygenase system ferredoxin subunit